MGDGCVITMELAPAPGTRLLGAEAKCRSGPELRGVDDEMRLGRQAVQGGFLEQHVVENRLKQSRTACKAMKRRSISNRSKCAASARGMIQRAIFIALLIKVMPSATMPIMAKAATTLMPSQLNSLRHIGRARPRASKARMFASNAAKSPPLA